MLVAVALLAVHRPDGSGFSRNICGWHALLHVAADHGRGDARAACFARSIASTSSVGGHDQPHRPGDPGGIAFVAERSVRRLRGDLVRHRPRRRPAHLVLWRGASCAGTGHLKGIRPTLRPTVLPGAWRFAIDVNLAASVQAVWGPIAPARRRRTARARGRGFVPRRIDPCRQRAKAGGLPGQGLLSGNHPDGSDIKQPWKLMLRGTAARGGVAARDRAPAAARRKAADGPDLRQGFLGAYAARHS